jgi:hypothetical protein
LARIRSIKPEFPQSESMGRVSRDARLLFIQIWTLCDDSGRTRAASRMLASLLFPYDNDAPALIDGWLAELEREQCIVRYSADGSSYIQVCKWLNHQKIDHASPSKIPEFAEGSRIPREASRILAPDQGSRIKDQGGDQGGEEEAASPADPEPADDGTLKLVPPAAPRTARSNRKERALAVACPADVEVQTWADWLELRKSKKAPVTATVVKLAKAEATKAGMPLGSFLEIWCARGSQGLQAEWLKPNERAGPSSRYPTKPSIAESFAEKTYIGTPDHELPEHLRRHLGQTPRTGTG